MHDELFSRRDILKTLGAGIAGFAAPLPLAASEREASLTPGLEYVVREMERTIDRSLIEGRIPSITVALVAGDEVVWTSGQGQSNLWARTPAVPSTVYFVGSIYKTVNAAAILQLVEQGKLGLDDPVRSHLPFPIAGEDPIRPILVRHLLTHTSGLGGNPPRIHHDVWGDTVPPPLEDYLRTQLSVDRPPLEQVVYSNLAFTLAGYLVELVSGVPFREYLARNIFSPLGMSSTAFIPTPQMRERLAVPYGFDEEEQLIPLPHLKTNHYPAGAVWSPVGELGRWLAVSLNDGEIGQSRVLSTESIAEMHRPQFPQFLGQWSGFGIGQRERTGFGLGWLTGEREGERLIGHSGSLNGYTSFVAGNLTRRHGVALMSNRIRAHEHLTGIAEHALLLMQKYLRG